MQDDSPDQFPLGMEVAVPRKEPAWERVQLARHAKRPHTLDYFERIFSEFSEIHGDRFFGDDPSIVSGMGFFDGNPLEITDIDRIVCATGQRPDLTATGEYLPGPDLSATEANRERALRQLAADLARKTAELLADSF